MLSLIYIYSPLIIHVWKLLKLSFISIRERGRSFKSAVLFSNSNNPCHQKSSPADFYREHFQEVPFNDSQLL